MDYDDETRRPPTSPSNPRPSKTYEMRKAAGALSQGVVSASATWMTKSPVNLQRPLRLQAFLYHAIPLLPAAAKK